MDTKNAETFYNDEHFIEDSEQFRELFEDQKLCDITLISADDKFKIRAHKKVLTSVSEYFLAMFGGSMRESEAKDVKLTQIDGSSLKLILDFIYRGIIELTTDTVNGVIMAADVLQLRALKDISYNYMLKNINASNCLSISHVAKLLGYDKLYNWAMLYVCEHFVELKDEDEFLSQTSDELCQLISQNDLRASGEGDILLSVMAWITYEKEDRNQFLEELLTKIRFPLLTPRYISGLSDKLGESVEMLRFLYRTFTWHAAPHLRPQKFPQEQCKIRCLKDVIVAISGFKDSENDLNVALYYPSMEEWIYANWPAVPYSRNSLRYTICHKKLYVTYGPDAQDFSNRVDCFNFEKLEWEEVPSLRSSPVSIIITLENSIYAISNESINILEESFEDWETRQPSDEIILENSQVYCTWRDKLYVLKDNAYFAYDLKGNRFETLVRRERDNYVIGFHILCHKNTEYLVEITGICALVYDLHRNKCVSRNTILFEIPQDSVKTALHGENILIFGTNKIYEFNVFKNKMHTLPKLVYDNDVEVLLTNTYN